MSSVTGSEVGLEAGRQMGEAGNLIMGGSGLDGK